MREFSQWRAKMLAYAREADSEFTILRPPGRPLDGSALRGSASPVPAASLPWASLGGFRGRMQGSSLRYGLNRRFAVLIQDLCCVSGDFTIELCHRVLQHVYALLQISQLLPGSHSAILDGDQRPFDAKHTEPPGHYFADAFKTGGG